MAPRSGCEGVGAPRDATQLCSTASVCGGGERNGIWDSVHHRHGLPLNGCAGSCEPPGWASAASVRMAPDAEQICSTNAACPAAVAGGAIGTRRSAMQMAKNAIHHAERLDRFMDFQLGGRVRALCYFRAFAWLAACEKNRSMLSSFIRRASANSPALVAYRIWLSGDRMTAAGMPALIGLP